MKRSASFCFKTCAWSYKSKKYYCWHSFTVATHLPWLFAVAICRSYLPWEFAVGICRSYLPWEFTVANCHENLPQLFAVRICCDYLPWVFVYVSKSFLVYVSKSCLYGSKSFLFVKCSLLMVLLFVIVMAVMGHRTKVKIYSKMAKSHTVKSKSHSFTYHLRICRIWFTKEDSFWFSLIRGLFLIWFCSQLQLLDI